MQKLPRRLFRAGDAVDVDDFNETLYEYGSESGRLTDHNCDEDILGTNDATRITHTARGAHGVTHSRVSTFHTTGVLPIIAGTGWTVVESTTVTTQAATLRVNGRATVNGTPSRMYGGVRINGVLVYESRMFTPGGATWASAIAEVPQGTHTVELVVQQFYHASISAKHTTLSVFGFEK